VLLRNTTRHPLEVFSNGIDETRNGSRPAPVNISEPPPNGLVPAGHAALNVNWDPLGFIVWLTKSTKCWRYWLTPFCPAVP
jgi:hypothetical protein